jgi:hypothetical protein
LTTGSDRFASLSTQYIYFGGDSIVAGKAYKKVFSCDDELHENITYEGLLREQDKKTYGISKDSETEYLLYDFSLEAGMTFEFSCLFFPCCELCPQLVYVKYSDTIEVNGKPRKRLQFSMSDGGTICDTWIEGIGSLYGILTPFYPLSNMDGFTLKLLCHYEDDELVYRNQAYSECHYDRGDKVRPNSSWSVLHYRTGPIPSVSTQYIYFDGDSIVAGKAYKKVFSCDDKLHENIRYEGLIRELDKKTYFIPKDFEAEYVLYDFSLEEGTNFEYQTQPQNSPTILYVKKVDFVENNGIQKKRIQFTSPPPDDDQVYATWIEGIGSLTGLLYPLGTYAPNSTIEILLCYYENDERVYKNQDYSECYYNNVEDTGEDTKTSAWDYPVKPGMDEWANLKTGEEQLEACQIPKEVLDALNAKDLVEICLNYPLLFNYTASNDERKGMRFMIENFNGLKELSTSKDGIKELIRVYADYPVFSQIPSKESKDYDAPYKLSAIELFLSDSACISLLDDNELCELKEIALGKYEAKLRNADVYSVYSLNKSRLLAAVIVEQLPQIVTSTEQDEAIQRFLLNINANIPELLTKISEIIAEPGCDERKEILWDYPVKPGTEEWAKLEGRKARVDTCQAPAAVLQDISTYDLMNLCLQYPFLYDVFAFNNINSGLDKLFDDFNGIREFAQREDALEILWRQYESDIQHFSILDSDTSNYEKGGYMLQLSLLEALLSYSRLHHDASQDIQTNILQALWVGYQRKCSYADYFQGIGFLTNLFSRAHIIALLDAEYKELFAEKWSVLYSGVTDAAVINEIDELTRRLISDNVINDNACGVTQPQKNLPWLAELIEKAEVDATYSGFIWLEKYKGQDVFVTDIMKWSARAYHTFDCQGNDFNVDWTDAEIFYNNLKNVIYRTPYYRAPDNDTLSAPCSDTKMNDIYTPMGSHVTAWSTCEYSTATRVRLDSSWSSRYPDAERIAVYDGLSSTHKFNGHGYAWLRTEQNIDSWIGRNATADEDIYTADGSYTEISQETYPGKVSWADNDHSAVTTSEPGWFISKWGRGPLFRHRWNDSPYGTDNLKYYAKSDNADKSTTGLQSLATNGASLQQNSPNPFSQSTVIRYTLPQTDKAAQLVVSSTAGSIVRQIPLQPGTDSVTIEGGALAVGIYYYSLYVGSSLVDTKTMVLTK